MADNTSPHGQGRETMTRGAGDRGVKKAAVVIRKMARTVAPDGRAADNLSGLQARSHGQATLPQARRSERSTWPPHDLADRWLELVLIDNRRLDAPGPLPIRCYRLPASPRCCGLRRIAMATPKATEVLTNLPGGLATAGARKHGSPGHSAVGPHDAAKVGGQAADVPPATLEEDRGLSQPARNIKWPPASASRFAPPRPPPRRKAAAP